MPITYSIERSRNLVVEVWTGNVSVREVRAYWKRYFADPQVRAVRRSLADLRGCTSTITGPQLAALVDEGARALPEGPRWTTALLVTTPQQYGVAHQFHAFAHRSTTSAIFYDCEEALRWLREQEARQASGPAEDAEQPARLLGAVTGQ